MLNSKLKAITKYIGKDDYVLDTCCDHAYLAIYLKKNNLCQEVCASDISENALAIAKKNINNYNLQIKTYLSDGFKNISNSKINTVVISGVGTTTVLDIIKFIPQNIKKIIISSNNKHYELRESMSKLGFFLTNEEVVLDNNKYYPIMCYIKKKVHEKKDILKYGKSSNKDYFNYLINSYQNVLNNMPKKHIIKRIKLKKDISKLKKLTLNS